MKNFLTLMTFLGSFVAYAGEGFFSKSDLPNALKSAWESTFFISPKIRGQIGSAFVFKKVPDSDQSKVQLYLLASDHVVKTMCGEKSGYCDDMILSASVGINLDTLQDIIMDRRGLTIVGVEVVYREPQPDLSLLKVTVDRDQYIDIMPIPFVQDCRIFFGQEIFIMGFPATGDRTALDAKPITKKSNVIRRFSKGFVVGNIKSDSNLDESTSFWVGTTADALEGISGGPALLASGHFFGVLDSASLSDRNGLAYNGNEKVSPMQWHSLVTRCELVKDFMNQKPLSFLQEIKNRN